MTLGRFRLLCAVCLLVLEAAFAQAATLTFVPADTSVTLGDHVVFRAVLDAQPDVKAASLGWIWSPSRIAFVGAHAGGVFTSTPLFTEFLIPDVDAPADSAFLDAAVLTGTGHGPGVLVFIEFVATALGNTLVECAGADLRDVGNAQTLPSCSGSTIHILGPVPAHHARWAELKSRFR